MLQGNTDCVKVKIRSSVSLIPQSSLFFFYTVFLNFHTGHLLMNVLPNIIIRCHALLGPHFFNVWFQKFEYFSFLNKSFIVYQ